MKMKTIFIIFLTYLLLFSTSENGIYGEELCPFGWTYDVKRGRCIKAMDQVMEYENAAISCRSCGGGLIRLENRVDQDTADDLIIAHTKAGERTEWGYFIDMNDKETTTVWKFENGDAVTWINWARNQPNGQEPKYLPDGQHCMALEYSSFKWHDTACRGKNLHYICMRKPGPAVLVDGIYVKQSAGCLGGHRTIRGLNFSEPDGLQTFHCAVECNEEVCCVAFVVGNNECLLYAFDPDHEAANCEGPSYNIYTKQYIK